MDMDRFIVRNGGAWRRLEELSERARKGGRKGLDASQLDELVALYQRTAAQLSYARAQYDDPGLTARLTTIVAGANATIYGYRPVSVRTVGRFFSETFPAAVWVSRRFIAAAAVLLFVPALAIGVWLANSPEALDIAVPAEGQNALIQKAEGYYSSKPASEFSTQVLINNIQVSFLAFAAGILLCVGTAFFLILNAVNIGALGGLFVHAGKGGEFFGLILPHGLLELTAIVIAGGAGFRLGWAIIAPGDRTRVDALAEEGRRSVVIVLGLMLCFVVAGLIEGFVTPSGLPTWGRIGFGIVVETLFLSWIVVRGREAESRGLSGLFSETP
jgi:uncharacterized membrane protein SpoIIM required for sporulation